MATTTARGADTRARILEAATRLFLEHGFAATGVNDVLRASGVTKGGLYFHFRSKAALGLAVLEGTREEFRRRVLEAVGSHDRATDQMVATVRAIARQKPAEPAMAALGYLAHELARDPGLATGVRPFDPWPEVCRDLLLRARAEGDLPADLDIEPAARFVVEAYVGLDLVAHLARCPSGEESVESYLRFVFRSLGVTAPIPSATLDGGVAGR